MKTKILNKKSKADRETTNMFNKSFTKMKLNIS